MGGRGSGGGGARPGAGRKTKSLEDEQSARRAMVLKIISRDEWTAMVRAQLEQAKAGSLEHFRELASYIVGAKPAVPHTTVEVDNRTVTVHYVDTPGAYALDDADRAILGLDPAPATRRAAEDPA